MGYPGINMRLGARISRRHEVLALCLAANLQNQAGRFFLDFNVDIIVAS